MPCEKKVCWHSWCEKIFYILGLGKKVKASLNNRLLSVPQKNLDSFKFQDLGEEHKYVFKNKDFLLTYLLQINRDKDNKGRPK